MTRVDVDVGLISPLWIAIADFAIHSSKTHEGTA